MLVETVFDKNTSVLQLEKIIASLESKFPELAFTLGHVLGHCEKILVVTQRALAFMPPFGYTSCVQVTIGKDCSYRIHVLLRELECSTVTDEGKLHALLKKIFNVSSKFCPGIEWKHYHEHYFDVIRFHPKSLHRTEAPFYCIDSVNCKLLFEVPQNAPLTVKSCAEVTCSAYKQLVSDLD